MPKGAQTDGMWTVAVRTQNGKLRSIKCENSGHTEAPSVVKYSKDTRGMLSKKCGHFHDP